MLYIGTTQNRLQLSFVECEFILYKKYMYQTNYLIPLYNKYCKRIYSEVVVYFSSPKRVLENESKSDL